MKTALPLDSNERKNHPVATGCLDYFPAALAGVAKHSKDGNDKHNPGQPLHHSRGKSADHTDCIVRHVMDFAAFLATIENEPDKVKPEYIAALMYEVNALSWRALALNQEMQERFNGAPLAPRARLPALPAPEAPYHPGWIEGCGCTMCTRERAEGQPKRRESKVARTPGDDVDYPVNR